MGENDNISEIAKRPYDAPHDAARHDHLTALYNRQYFITLLGGAFNERAADPQFRFALLLLDIDHFKRINDGFSHRIGDLLLVEIAGRLRHCAPDAVIARLGCDEFALLISGAGETGKTPELAAQIVAASRQPVQVNGQEIFVSATIGVVFEMASHTTPEQILHDADIALHDAKTQDQGYVIFDDARQRATAPAAQLQAELQRALARSEFFMEYQPIFELPDQKLKGLEALIRWQHPARGRLLPGEFIGAAEDMGLIRQIGGRVLHQACKQMREWQKTYPDAGLRLSVNISGHQLTDTHFIPALERILADTGLNPCCLQLEVTESVLFAASEPIIAVIGAAQTLGIRFALDDFGTGYSSLGYLNRYPIDAIKIDQSFVSGLPRRQRTVSIVKAIIDLAHALSLEVTAEGIEEDAQLQSLLSLGCTQVQGFLLGRPLSVQAVGNLLESKKSLF